MQQETVIVLDFGGQYNQLIARRVRECNVYCEIYSYRTDLAKIKAKNPKGIIFTGGPNSAYLPDSPTIDPEIYTWGVPILGICYGSQLMMHNLGGEVCKAPEREYGKTLVSLDTTSPLFEGLPENNVCWMSHNDYIKTAAPGFSIVAHTPNCPVAAAQDQERGLYCVQFHPEVLHTETALRFCTISCIRSVAVPVPGRWIPLWNTLYRSSAPKSATARCFALCPAAWTPASVLLCWLRLWASS